MITFYDTHLHSTGSDGADTPKELVEKIICYLDAQELKCGHSQKAFVVLTDHDTVCCTEEFLKEAAKYPDKIETLPGIEISSDYEGNEVHILGYGIDYKNPEFLETLAAYRRVRDQRNVKMVEKLQQAGMFITMEDLLEKCSGETLGRAAIATVLMEKGYVKTRQEAFDKYIGNDKPCFVGRMLTPAKEVIELICRYGGTPVLAHPMLCKKLTPEEKDAMIRRMAVEYDYKIQGIETYYSENDLEEQEFTEATAKKYGLFVTLGSDYHGSVKPGLDLFDGRRKTGASLQFQYEFRDLKGDEAERLAFIEAECFPPSEACTLEIMKERVRIFPETFLVAVHKVSGQIIGFIDGLASNEEILRDEFFTDNSLHEPDGKTIMLQGVDVLPQFQMRGIARAMMAAYIEKMQKQGRKRIVLTCVPGKISMYQKFGYTDLGPSDSAWGGEAWHEMDMRL